MYFRETISNFCYRLIWKKKKPLVVMEYNVFKIFKDQFKVE